MYSIAQRGAARRVTVYSIAQYGAARRVIAWHGTARHHSPVQTPHTVLRCVTILSTVCRRQPDLHVPGPMGPTLTPRCACRQRWNFTASGHLITTSTAECLDWTSKVGADGGHRVYMNSESTSFPHQRWHLTDRLTSDDANGLCLDWLSRGASSEVQMRPCM